MKRTKKSLESLNKSTELKCELGWNHLLSSSKTYSNVMQFLEFGIILDHIAVFSFSEHSWLAHP